MRKIKDNGTVELCDSAQVSSSHYIITNNNNKNKSQELVPVGEIRRDDADTPTTSKVKNFDFSSVRVVASSTVVLNELGKELLKSAREGDVDNINNLLTRGAPFSADWLGTSPLHLAAQNNHAAICEILLRAGISIDARTKVDRTPLHMAAYEGHLKVVSILVKHEADINCRDLLDMTPLHWAVQNGHFKVVQFLVKRGADIHATNKFTLAPADIAAQINRNDIIEFINSYASDSTVATQNLVLQLQAETGNENDIMQVTEDSCNEDDPGMVPPVESIFISTGFEEDIEQPSFQEEQQETGFVDPVNTSESNYMEEESQNIADQNGFSVSAMRLLQEHGLTMIQAENEETNILNTVMESGHSVVLTDIGKEVLNSVKQSEQEAESQTTRRIITVTPEEFLAMTNGFNNSNNVIKNNNNIVNRNKALPPKQGVKRIVMKKNKLVPITSKSTVPGELKELRQVSKNQRNDMEQVVAQLIEARKTIEEYKIKLKQKEIEAERYKMQLKLLLDS